MSKTVASDNSPENNWWHVDGMKLHVGYKNLFRHKMNAVTGQNTLIRLRAFFSRFIIAHEIAEKGSTELMQHLRNTTLGKNPKVGRTLIVALTNNLSRLQLCDHSISCKRPGTRLYSARWLFFWKTSTSWCNVSYLTHWQASTASQAALPASLTSTANFAVGNIRVSILDG